MQKILAALAAAAAFVFNHKPAIEALKKQIAERDKTIEEGNAERERLLELIEAEQRDDAALEAAAVEARNRQAEAEQNSERLKREREELDGQIRLADEEADRIIKSINEDDSIPMTIGADGQASIGPIPAS